jgi:penicillin amidase
MPEIVRRLLKALLIALLIILLAAVVGAFWARSRFRASLPQLDGMQQLSALTAPVRVERDRLGIPSIRGATREDVARALGFLHAQDRFFQMDLARRRAAGELAALVGARALALDHEIRIHRFRAEARRALQLLTADSRRIIDAYADGVNAGLTSLDAPPFEYLVLRQQPVPWQPEDSFLVVLSMFITLQDTDGSYESALGTMHDVLAARDVRISCAKGNRMGCARRRAHRSVRPRFPDLRSTTCARDVPGARRCRFRSVRREYNSRRPRIL